MTYRSAHHALICLFDDRGRPALFMSVSGNRLTTAHNARSIRPMDAPHPPRLGIRGWEQQMTKTYSIGNTISGADLGAYEGATEAEALDAMARDAGYTDYAEAQSVAPAAYGEIVATEMTKTYSVYV